MQKTKSKTNGHVAGGPAIAKSAWQVYGGSKSVLDNVAVDSMAARICTPWLHEIGCQSSQND